MPETYIPEPDPTPAERVAETLTQAVAGQGIVRRVVLYVAVAALLITPLPTLAIVPLVLLLATDRNLS